MLIEEGRTLAEASMKAGMSEVTGRRYRELGVLPSEARKRHDWLTHRDAFDAVWPQVMALLEREPGLQAKTVFEELCRLYPGGFQEGQLRTLQRRIKRWRATCGPAKEVFFPQMHEPGRLGASDFTDCSPLGVTILRSPFDHLLFHFVLTYSNWEHVSIQPSESFEALSEGLQGALRALGGAPKRHRTDQLSAAVRQLAGGGEAFTLRYEALLSHYGISGEKTQPASPQENGDCEQSHHRLKQAIDQALMLRGSRDFDSREEYEGFVGEVVAKRNGRRKERFEEERAHLLALPPRGLEACRDVAARVGPSSTIRVAHNSAFAADRRAGAGAAFRGTSGDLAGQRDGRRPHRAPSRREPCADRLPPCDRFVVAQTRRLFPLPVPRGIVPDEPVSRGFRCAGDSGRGTSGKGVSGDIAIRRNRRRGGGGRGIAIDDRCAGTGRAGAGEATRGK